MNQNILKGIFIILVVVDHNNFARTVFPRFLDGFGFHVLGFMIVPFLRPALPLGHDLSHYLYRLAVPFLVATTLLSIVVCAISPIGIGPQAHRWLEAIYTGNAYALKDATRMALLWFLPSFLTLVALRSAIEHLGGTIRVAAIGILWLVHPFIGTFGRSIQDYVPMGLIPALYVLPLAYLGVWLHRSLFARLGAISAVLSGCTLYVLVKTAQMHFDLRNEIGFSAVADYRDPMALLLNDSEAVAGVLMIFQFGRLPLGRLIEACGRYSLQIYLFHAFVAVLIYRLCIKLIPHSSALVLFMLSMTVTVLATLALGRFLTRQPILRQILFPRTLHETRALWPRRAAIAAPDGKGQS